jgi:hypothetical protein
LLLIVDLVGQLLLLLTLIEHHLTAAHTACTRALPSCVALRSLLLVFVRSTLRELGFLSVVKRHRLVASAGGAVSRGLSSSGGGLILQVDTFPLGLVLALTEEVDASPSVEREPGVG